MSKYLRVFLFLFFCFNCPSLCQAQDEKSKPDSAATDTNSESAGRSRQQEIELGSSIAKGGFQNEDEIRDKFNNWKEDSDVRLWLEKMNYRFEEVLMVEASKPHGEKADIKVLIKTQAGESTEGISIKLVSNPRGFNQIDKRWLKNYAQMWEIPESVHQTLKLFVGEKPPTKPGRDPRRMFFDEFDEQQRTELIDFFTANRERIVSDLFAGDGEHAAKWIMVTLKTSDPKATDGKPKSDRAEESRAERKPEPVRDSIVRPDPEWVLCTTKQAAEFFGGGEIQFTPQGSLKIGRITMQRKGGDNGRESANMLQFKINPVELFELKSER